MPRRVRARSIPLLVATAIALCLALQACLSGGRVRVEPVSAEASRAFDEARALARSKDREVRARAAERASDALAHAPGWVAPRRLLDDLAREDLSGVDALERHLEALAKREDAAELYLAGRLEGRSGRARFERAVHVDPNLAWGHHGLAWAASERGDAADAVDHARAALKRARGPSERAYFAASLARFLAAAKKEDGALELLRDELARQGLAALDRADLLAESVRIGLMHEGARERRDAYERGLELLVDPACDDQRVEELVTRLAFTPAIEDLEQRRLSLALSSQASPARDRWRARVELAREPSRLALGLLERAIAAPNAPRPSPVDLRRARFAAGDIERAVAEWRDALPRQVLGDDRSLADTRLARVAAAAQALSVGGDAEGRGRALVELGEAALAAGWFAEARGVAAELADFDLERALSIDARGNAGVSLLQELARAAARTDLPSGGDRRDGLEPIGSLREMLGALSQPIARAARFLGDGPDARAIVESPRTSYAGFATLIHPGPVFSRDDEREGLGRAGSEVPGLAAWASRLGRFALAGEAVGGGGPDMSILSLVRLEERSGEHLGVRWSGLVAWCEGADVDSRAGRAGASISGAALHEGYWIDIEIVRSEHATWTALRDAFADDRARVERALSTRGLRLHGAGADADEARRSPAALLGEGRRLRLAILADRAAPGEVLGRIPLEESIDAVARHEEGHLCDRSRFLPFTKRWPAALALLVSSGFSPRTVTERLEYRAQLTCLCVASDARVPLVQVLDSVEGGSTGVTAHAAAYTRLLVDWLAKLDELIAAEPAKWPSIDTAYTLAHQLHRLTSDEVRRVSLALAHDTF